MPAVRIVTFRAPVEAQQSKPDPERLLAGNPKLTVWNHFRDPSEQFFAGVWAATRGRWRVRYTETEFCHLLVAAWFSWARMASGTSFPRVTAS